MEIYSSSPAQTQKVGRDLANHLANKNLILIKGELGAGKTVLVKGLAQGLNIRENIVSPTFTIIKEYNSIGNKFSKLYHLDLYRLEGKRDLQKTIPIAELINDSGSLVVVEWAEKLKSSYPNAVRVNIGVINSDRRKISIINLKDPNPHIQKAAAVLNRGGIIIYPTDTAYGIGCRIDFPESVKKVFMIRKRPLSQAVPVLVADINMARKYYQKPLPPAVSNLTSRYWPGGLTIVYYKDSQFVDRTVSGGKNTIGLRMPNHLSTLSLISQVGVPILAPSANFHGNKTPFASRDLDQKLVAMVDFVLPGKCHGKLSSTVIDCTTQPPQIIRKGAVNVRI